MHDEVCVLPSTAAPLTSLTNVQPQVDCAYGMGGNDAMCSQWVCSLQCCLGVNGYGAAVHSRTNAYGLGWFDHEVSREVSWLSEAVDHHHAVPHIIKQVAATFFSHSLDRCEPAGV